MLPDQFDQRIQAIVLCPPVDLVRPGKKMFCFKRSLSEKFTCVEVIDRSLARNISPVFRCAPTQVTYTASLHHCLCLCFTSGHRFCVPPTCVCVLPLCTTSVFHRPGSVFHFCVPPASACVCVSPLRTASLFHRPVPVFHFCVRTIYRNRSGRSRICSVSDKWLDRTLG